MSRLWCLVLLLIWVLTGVDGWAQAKIDVDKPTKLSAVAGTSPDSTKAQVSNPHALTFTASTDQRFFFFNDTRNDNGKRVPVSVYGLRAGFLFPVRHPERQEPGGMRAAFKAGAGFYFVNQTLNRPGLLPNTSEAITRHLRIATLFFEPYLYRKKAIEVSVPLEIGYGHSRYNRVSDQTREGEEARGVFIPAGAGLSLSYQFPALRWFRPLHWTGFNILGGYRFILKKDVPESQVNYSGFYISIGPSFYLENLTADIAYWRKKHRQKKGKL
ncbi:hypothetical protein J2I47_10210 [Fibrella sp. HMF5335]|uniref:Uncharacterized protein n=1 Tax=Fibrella rubiginis TaxID=2817060 RepID=A0A939GI76_9BACT|nr:hypothetical protein [Fibrella rubiginis]MBO0936917.1 hypothetical protein [Fibrella rubiginis]